MPAVRPAPKEAMTLFSRAAEVNQRPVRLVKTMMRHPVLVLFCLLLGVAAASAQERQVWIRVEDPSGATIPAAQIIVMSGSDVVGEFTADNRGLALIKLGAATNIK